MASIHWATQVNGNFATAGLWTGGVVPGAADNAILDAAGATNYTVTSSASATVNSIQTAATATVAITGGTFTASSGTGGGANAGVILIDDNSAFEFSGGFDNTGAITVNGVNNTTQLIVGAGGATLTGGGTVTLNNDGNDRILGAVVGDTLTNVNNIISGGGQLGAGALTLINDSGGTIDANDATALTLNTGATVTNDGLIEATGSGGLNLQSTVDDSGGGTLFANGAAIALQGADIIGGTLKTAGGGAIDTGVGTNLLDGSTFTVSNTGTVNIGDDTALTVQGAIANTGQIDLNAVNNVTDLIIGAAGATLSGGGVVTLNNDGNNRIYGAGDTLTNVNNTISGAGQLGDAKLTLVNQTAGVIDATDSTALILNTSGSAVANSGLIESTNPGALSAVGGLEIASTTIVNSSTGVIEANGAATHVDLFSATISGGTLETANGGVIQTVDGGSLLDGLTVAAVNNTGLLSIPNNTALTIQGSIVNTGQIDLNAVNNFSELIVNANGASLSGKGAITLNNDGNNLILGLAAGDTLTNVDNTISGAGQIGDGKLTLINDSGGTIDATDSAVLFLNPGNTVTNDGLIESTGAGGLTILNSTINGSSGGTLFANGGAIDLQVADIVGGTLKTAAGGAVDTISDGNTFDSSTFTVHNTGTVNVLNDTNLTLIGALANTGQIDVDAGNSDTDLIVGAGGASLTGGGQVILDDDINNRIYDLSPTGADTLTNVDNTISGAGQIGLGDRLIFVNDAKGIVDATGANELLIQTGNTVNNVGLLESTNPGALGSVGGLVLDATTFANSTSGVIEANGAGTHVDLSGATISGGTLVTMNGGIIRTINGGNVLDGLSVAAVNNTGQIVLPDDTNLTIMGSIVNTGQIDVNAVNNDTDLIVGIGGATLTGGGEIVFNNDGNNRIYDASGTGADTLTNVDNTISGAGQIGIDRLTLVNEAKGTIDANDAVALTLETAVPVVNDGLIEATGAGGLVIAATTIDDSGGGTVFADGSTVLLEGTTTIIGGKLTAAAGGAFTTSNGGATLDSSKFPIALSAPVNIVDDTNLTIIGPLDNIGAINVEAVNNDTDLIIGAGGASLTGGGAINLNNDFNNRIYDANGAGTDTLTNVDSVISGAGQIGIGRLTLVNESAGIIDATDSNTLAIQANGGVANSGLLESTNPSKSSGALGGLHIIDTTISNTATGVIEANGAGTHIDLSSATISGGTLVTLNGGVIQTLDGGSLLDGLTVAAVNNTGLINLPDNTELHLQGSIVNTGQIDVSAVNNLTNLVVTNSGATLTGKGEIVLGDDGNNRFYGDSGGAVLTNVNNTISGAGQLGVGQLTLINDSGGTIDANDGVALVLDGAANTVVNDGLIEATGAGGLTIVSSTVDDSGGGVLLASNATIRLDNSDLIGGTLNTAGSGAFVTAGASSLLDGSKSAIDTTGSVILPDNTQLNIQGSIVNTGVISVEAVNNLTNLVVAGAGATLTGGGSVVLGDDGNNRFYGDSGGSVLTNVDNTISGAGQLGAGQLTLVNDVGGTIVATGSNALVLRANVVTNDGLIEASGPGGLTILDTTVDNNATGVIVANTHVGLQSATISGGTLEGAGFFQTLDSASVLDGTTATVNNQSQINLNDNTQLTIQGAIDNTGSINVDAVNNTTNLIVGGAGATLTGGGEIVLGDDGNNRFYGVSGGSVLTNVDNTISGAGQLGAGQLTLVNDVGGTIDATGSNALVLRANVVTNDGLIEASGPGGLTIDGTTVADGATGVIKADTHINLESATISGGTLVGATGAFFQTVDGGSVLDGTTATVNNQAQININDDTALTIQGTIDNTGSINVDAVNNTTELLIGAAGATLTGGGAIVMDNDGNNRIFSPSAGGALTNFSNTISGAGQLGDGQMTLVNDAGGTIDANDSTTLVLNTGGNVITNAGLIEATASGGLTIQSAIDNTGALEADGGNITVNGAVSGLTGTTLLVSGNIDFTSSFSGGLDFAGAGGVIELAQSQSFTGTVSGFSTHGGANVDDLDLADITSAGATATFLGTATSGTLTVTNGTQTSTLTLLGDYTRSAFQTASDGHGGTLVFLNGTIPFTMADTYNDAVNQTLTVSAANGVLANDIDTNGLTFTAALNTGPTHGAVTLKADGSFVYTPTAGFSGADTFTYIAKDAIGSSAPVTVTINVSAQTPISNPDSYADGAGKTLGVNAATGVLANDVDPNGLTLTAALATGPTHGAVTLNADGSFNYTPTLGFAGKDSFTYIASDSLGSGPPTTVTITVTASAPTSTADSYADGAGKALTVNAASGVLANDVDNNGLALTAAVATGPAHGALTLNANGSFTYTPTLGFAGKDTFTYVPSDALSTGIPTTVTVNVTATAPTSAPDSFTDAVNQTLTVAAASGVLSVDTDNNGLALTATVATGPAHGALTLNANGSFTYTPTAGFTGKDSFTYVPSDSLSTGTATTVTINVGAGTPVSNPDSYTDGAGKTLSVNAATGVLANDTDPNGLTLTAAIATGPAHGAVTLNADGSFNYTPTLGFAGKDTFTYVASDGVASGPPTTVTVTVTATAPTSTADTYIDTVNQTLTVPAASGVLSVDTDNNGLALTATVATGPAHGALTLNANGSFTYTPTAGFTGKDSFTYVPSDSLSTGTATTVTINVGAGTPVANPDNYVDGAGKTLIVNAAAGVLANDTDPNGLTLSAAVATGPAHGTVTLSANGSFNYTPTLGFAGTDTFTYIASDGVASSAPATVTVTVNASPPTSMSETFTDAVNQTLTVAAASGVLSVDTDSNGLALTATLASSPTHGSVTLSPNGSFTYTPTAGFTGKDSFTYIPSDSLSTGVATTITINVSAGTPVSNPDGYADGAAKTLSVNAATGVLANDTDPNGLTLTAALATGPAHGAVTLNANGSFNYTPTLGFAGKDTFTYIASDGVASGAPTTVTITVNATAPTSMAQTYGDALNQTLTVAAASGVLAGDVDNNGLPLTATLTAGPAHGALTLNANGAFTYTPTAGFTGDDTFTYIPSDSLSTGAPTTVTIDVGAGGPVTHPVTYVDKPGQALVESATTGVLAGDTDTNHLPLSAALATGPAHGTVVLSALGAFRYTPNAGFVGVDTFTYIASDKLASSAPTTVTIDVTAGTPVSKADSYGDAAGHALTVSAAAGVLANDTDPNGLALSAALATGPAHGAVTLNANGSFTYTPTLGFAGADAFTYIASDGVASGTPTTVTLNVTATAPTSMAASYADAVGAVLTVAAPAGVLAGDTDNNGLALTATVATGPAHGALTLNANGSFTYTPTAGFTGKDSFTYVPSDSLSTGTATTVTINVGAGTPVANPDSYADGAGKTLSVNAATGVLANDTDPNGLALTAAIATGPAHGAVTLNANGSFTYTPTLGFAGKDTFTYVASDGLGSSAPTTVTLNVTAAAPTSMAASYADGEGKTLTVSAAGGVLAGDTDNNGLALSAALATGPAHGALTLNANGSFTYTPTAGFIGKDSFTYMPSDSLASGTATAVTITVTNGSPVAKPDAYADSAGHVLTVAAASGLLANDTDPNGLTLTAALSTGPAHGVVTVNPDGSFTYTPTLGFAGKDSFSYVASDGLASSAITTVSLTVTAAPPTSMAETYTDAAGQTLTVAAASGVLAGDTDNNGLPLTATLATGPAHGTLSLNANGAFTYTPVAGFTGKDSFTYVPSDALSTGTATTVNLNVTGAAPVANPVAYADAAGHTLTVTAASGVLAGDVDPNGLAMTAALATGPAHGVVTLNKDGSFSYTPTAGFVGKDTFTYIASDALASSPAATVTVNVTGAAPTSQPETYSDVAGQTLAVSAASGVLANDVDPNGLALTAALAAGPAHGTLTLNASGAFSYTPAAGFVGKDSFSYIASDSIASGPVTLVTLDVTGLAPITKAETYNAIANQTLTVSAANGVLAGDTDPNGLPMTAQLAPHGGPTHGTLTLNPDGSFTYVIHTGFAGFTGTDSFTYIATDGSASSAPTTVTIDITNGTASPKVAMVQMAPASDVMTELAAPAPAAAAAAPMPAAMPQAHLADAGALVFSTAAMSAPAVDAMAMHPLSMEMPLDLVATPVPPPMPMAEAFDTLAFTPGSMHLMGSAMTFHPLMVEHPLA